VDTLLFKFQHGDQKHTYLYILQIKELYHRLNLLWGVRAFYYDKFVSTDETLEDVNKMALEKGYLEPGDMVISLAAMPIHDRRVW